MIGTTRLVHSSIVKGVFRCSLTPRRHSTRALGRFRQWRPFRMALLPLGTWTSTSATTLAPPQCRWSSAVATEEVQEIPTTVLRRQKVRNVAIIAHVDHGTWSVVELCGSGRPSRLSLVRIQPFFDVFLTVVMFHLT